jgi:capsular exopolysaccharide synthesis family protein
MSHPGDSESYVRPIDTGDEPIDLRAYWRVVVRRRWLIASVFAAVVLATVLVTIRQTRIYTGTTSIIIDVSAPRVLDRDKVQDVVESGAGGYWYSKEYYETQYKVITSRAVAQRVIEKLNLARDRRFLGLEQLQSEKDVEEELARIDPVLELQDRLRVLPVKDSRVVRIQVDDRDPSWAAILANAVAEAYISENLSVRSTTTQNASDWLEQQLADLETKLAKSSDDLFKFKQAHDIVATSWEDRQSIVSQRLVAVNDALTKARVQKAVLESRSEQIEALSGTIEAGHPEAEAFALVSQSRTVQELKVRFIEATVECADLEMAYLDAHPKLETCQAKVRAARDGLLREIRTILEGARREYLEAVETERKLERLLDEAKSDAFGLNQHEKVYLELKRSHDNNQRLYELILQRLKETGVTGMLQMSNVRILDRAEPPDEPSRPAPLRNLAAAAALGAILALALAFLVEHLDDSVSSREEVEQRLGIPFLGIVPRVAEPEPSVVPETVVAQRPASAAAECLRSIRTNLLFMSPEKPLRTILVTSCAPGEGKTTCAAALAEVMASSGNKVLLIDADMRRPRVHKIFGIDADVGLSSMIVGDGPFDAIAIETAIPNLHVVPCGPIPPNPTELLHTPRFNSFLRSVAERYERVIIDSPPAGVVADAVVMSTLVDGTLLVLHAGRTSRDAAARSIRMLSDVQAKVFGAVLNDLDLHDQRYGAQYQYRRYGYYAAAVEVPEPESKDKQVA